jgi:hypothetical protein
VSDDRWQRLNDLFHAAVAMDDGERRAFLDDACAGDAELGREVERLAGAHRPAMAAFHTSMLGDVVQALDDADPLPVAGRELGAYRVMVRLGDAPGALPSYRRSQELRAADVKVDPANLWKRSSLIESLAKICKTLAGTEGAAAAGARCRETADLMQETAIDPTNAAIRSFFATTYADLGEAYATLAGARAARDDQRQGHWRTARDMFARSAAVWQDLRSRGILSKVDGDKPESVAREIARCDAALGR